MSEMRDFKGVWIPKEIWLSKELTLLEKIIFVEIDSLDNEEHCIASNEYFAEFCNCSESKVSKAIKKLEELGMVEVLSFDGRHRKIRVVKNTRQDSKKYEAESQKIRANNIANKTVNNKDFNSKELKSGKPYQLIKKPSLYEKCISELNSRNYPVVLHNALVDYLKLRLQITDKPLYTNSWKGLLNKLERDFTEDERLEVVYQSTERGYASFFPVNKGFKNYSQSEKPWEKNVRSVAMTKEEREAEEAEADRLEALGIKARF